MLFRSQGPFTDHGKMFRSNEIGVQNSIDPSFLQYEGRNYLVWGSFRGIYVIELTEDGLSLKPGAEKKRIAGTAFEAAYIHKHGDYYYMFASIGSCCEGIRSTYKVVVGRSKKVWDSCNYTCPVYNTGAEGLEELIKKLAKKIHKGENHRGKVCWYGN